MLGNLINRHDAARLYRKLRQGHLRQIADKVRAPGPKRVMDFWSAPGHGSGPVQWDDIPAVRRRWHTFGGMETRFAEHAARRWLSGRSGLQALSLGCGEGDRELEWARLGVFAQITGVDISPEQIERATRNAKEAGLDHLVSFHVADAQQALHQAEGQCDVVLALNSLHHFSRSWGDHAADRPGTGPRRPADHGRVRGPLALPVGQRADAGRQHAPHGAPRRAPDPARRAGQEPGGPPEPTVHATG